jgi:hypothetical protein
MARIKSIKSGHDEFSPGRRITGKRADAFG